MLHQTYLFTIVALSTIVQPQALHHVPVPLSVSRLHPRAASQSVLLANGKAAQKLNAQFTKMASDTSCQTGDMGCVAGAFSQCVSGKYVGTPCPAPLKCFALPLLLKEGTSLGCDTEEDAKARIANTGASGGLLGNNQTGEVKPEASSSNNTATTSSKPTNATVSGVMTASNSTDMDATDMSSDDDEDTLDCIDDEIHSNADATINSSNSTMANSSSSSDLPGATDGVVTLPANTTTKVSMLTEDKLKTSKTDKDAIKNSTSSSVTDSTKNASESPENTFRDDEEPLKKKVKK